MSGIEREMRLAQGKITPNGVWVELDDTAKDGTNRENYLRMMVDDIYALGGLDFGGVYKVTIEREGE